MYRSRWRRASALAASAMTAAAGGAALTGCGGGNAASRISALNPTASAGAAGQAGPVTPAKLAGALLTKINGAPASQPPAKGSYQSLPQVKAAEREARGAGASQRACAQAALTGMRSGALEAAPAAAVSFKVGRNGVSEMLAAPSPATAGAVLSRALPSSCAHYRARVGGKSYSYTVREQGIAGIGEQARALSVQTTGKPAARVWSVVFRGAGFIGSITVAGPNASELAVRELGLQAYGFAAKTLS